MSKKLILAAMVVGFVAACAPKPEPVPEPVTEEPVSTGKL